jgi:hypothetical protein
MKEGKIIRIMFVNYSNFIICNVYKSDKPMKCALR